MPKTLEEAIGMEEGGNPEESQGPNEEVSKVMAMMDQMEAMMEDPAMMKMMQESGMGDRLKQMAESLSVNEGPSEDDLGWEESRDSANVKMKKRGL